MASLAEARSHNVPPEVFLRHWRDIRDAKNAHADTGTAIARAKKSAKGAGIDLDALKLIEKLSDLDVDEIEVLLRHVRIYGKWLDLPLGTQANMFAEPDVPPVPPEAQSAHQEHVAGEAGATAGKAGHERGTNPHVVGSQQYVAWDKAWAKGHKLWMKDQSTIAKRMGENAKGKGDDDEKVTPISKARKQRANGAGATAH